MSDIAVQNLIDVSPSAVDELKKAGVGKEEFLRISMVSGGCAGLSYQMTTDTVVTPFDLTIFEDQDVKAITDKNSLQYLEGLAIDYSDDLIDVGFRFSNPNAAHTCGCGNSMSV
jgi:iron-sulfur cluster assembly protein